VIWELVASKKLTEKNILDLLKKGKTTLIKGFKSKAKKPFDARLKLEEDFRVTFDFGGEK
jgi:DNA topoisomerase III